MLRLPSLPPSWRLLLAACTLIAGEAAGFGAPAAARAWPWAALALLVAALAGYGWNLRHTGWISLFALGAILALRTDAQLAEVLSARTRLRLPVDAPVQLRPRSEGGWTAEFPSHAGPVPLRVVLPVAANAAVPSAGACWEVEGRISRREDGANRFARRTLWVRCAGHARPAEAGVLGRVRARWERLATAIASGLGAGLEWNPELAGLNRAILLGRRDEITPLRRRVFADAGTIHVFAISGLHVMVVAWFLDSALLRLGVPHRIRGLSCLPPLWAYVVLTGAHPSAVRAALMSTLCLAATAFNRRPDALIAWSATALAVYGLHPARIFDLGCTFSFAVMLGIVLWIRWSRRYRSPFPREWHRAGRLAGEFGVSLAAWAAGVPIAAHVFGRFTPGGLLANFVVIRCATPLVRLGAGSMAAGVFCLPLAALLNNATALFTWTMVLVSEQVSKLPFANVEVRPWSFAQCACWYAGCGAALVLLGKILPGRGRRTGRWWA